jgi:hypothetical protein
MRKEKAVVSRWQTVMFANASASVVALMRTIIGGHPAPEPDRVASEGDLERWPMPPAGHAAGGTCRRQDKKRPETTRTMAQTVRISLDAMGGDNGAKVVVAGAALALERRPDIVFSLFGDRDVVAPLLEAYPRLRDTASLHHCEVSVAMDAKPSQALRQGRWRPACGARLRP